LLLVPEVVDEGEFIPIESAVGHYLWVWFGKNTSYSAQARQYGFPVQFASTSLLPAGTGGGGGKHSMY